MERKEGRGRRQREGIKDSQNISSNDLLVLQPPYP